MRGPVSTSGVDVRAPADVEDENGVDRTLIRWALGRTPTECLELLEELLDLTESAQRVDRPLR